MQKWKIKYIKVYRENGRIQQKICIRHEQSSSNREKAQSIMKLKDIMHKKERSESN